MPPVRPGSPYATLVEPSTTAPGRNCCCQRFRPAARRLRRQFGLGIGDPCCARHSRLECDASAAPSAGAAGPSGFLGALAAPRAGFVASRRLCLLISSGQGHGAKLPSLRLVHGSQGRARKKTATAPTPKPTACLRVALDRQGGWQSTFGRETIMPKITPKVRVSYSTYPRALARKSC